MNRDLIPGLLGRYWQLIDSSSGRVIADQMSCTYDADKQVLMFRNGEIELNISPDHVYFVNGTYIYIELDSFRASGNFY